MRVLLTRGTSWQQLQDWRILELTDKPNLLTAHKRAQLSGCLTPVEAVRITFRRFPDAEVYCWDEPNYIPDRCITDHKAVRIVGTATGKVWATQ